MKFDVTFNLNSKIQERHLFKIARRVEGIHKILHDSNSMYKGSLGWLTLPTNIDREELKSVEEKTTWINKNCDYLIVVGTGGSFLGAVSVISAITQNVENGKTKVIFVGNSMDARELHYALSLIKTKSVAINFISKSGGTLEPTVAFGLLYKAMQEKYKGADLKQRIICTTDAVKGALKEFATANGFLTFNVPDDIGGRFSVLTAVGLFPIAVSGVDISALLEGAKYAQDTLADATFECGNAKSNKAYMYAAALFLLEQRGYKINNYVFTCPSLEKIGAWLVQLFSESGGKEGKGIMPICSVFPRDLHSIGQHIQSGTKNLFETIIHFTKQKDDILLDDFLNVGYGGKTVAQLNNIITLGAKKAHIDGGVPVIEIEMEELGEKELGYLLYFFELSCSVYCMLNNVNPFNQPGVEEYKKNVKAEMLK